MTMGHESDPGRAFVRSKLPWIVAAVAFVVYLVTLNPWLSIFNLQAVANIAGWQWQPEYSGPVYYAITYPLHWVPANWIPTALNLFSAVCAALVLGQLARCVALLPHDRTHEQRERERSEHSFLSVPLNWVPPVLAVLVCGLQLTFWERATNGTTEMLNLLMFAYVVRCLLEFRIDQRESRLTRAALVYGLGMTNNFAMVAYLPLFVMALIWIRGFSFFNLGFLTRMALCGLAGLSLYLLLPLVAWLSSAVEVGFWETLKYQLKAQKDLLMALPFNKAAVFFGNRPMWVLTLFSLIPIFLISIRWPSHFGDISKLGITLTTWMLHVAHAAFFVICLWVAFDPPFSPREMGLPLMSFPYLGALSIGYCAGYFLLVFRPVERRARRVATKGSPLQPVATAIIIALLVVMPVGLLLRNLADLRTTNGPLMKQFAESLCRNLPQRAVLLSDNPDRLILARTWLAGLGREKDYLPLHTQSLKWTGYHQYLKKKVESWPVTLNTDKMEQIGDVDMIRLMMKLAETWEIYYLHNSFGYYFEFFRDEPHGQVQKLTLFQSGALLPAPLSPEIVQENEVFWDKIYEETLAPLAKSIDVTPYEKRSGPVGWIFKNLHLRAAQNPQAVYLASYYSRALNYWGVELQKVGEFEKAKMRFSQALELNPNNAVAQVNLKYNADYQAGNYGVVKWTDEIEDSFGPYRSWEEVLNVNGPYDEPSLCYAQAYRFLQGNLYRQAAECFDRVRSLTTNNLASELWLAHLHNLTGLPDKALEITAKIQANAKGYSLNNTNRGDLLAIDASAYYKKEEPEKAVQLLEAAVEKNPSDPIILGTVARVYSDHGNFTNAQQVISRLLKLKPNDPATLINKGVIEIRAKEFDAAIATLTRVLTVSTNSPEALFNRAIAYLQSDKLSEAKQDYETLQARFPNSHRIAFGLGEIAYREKNTNAAIQHYRTYLSNAIPNTAESAFVSNRLYELRGGQP